MPDAVIMCDQLVKSFDGVTRILDGVSLTVSAGETVAILGRSGTGKSVLLKTIIALMDPDSGTVTVFGKDLHQLDERARLAARRGIGYVFRARRCSIRSRSARMWGSCCTRIANPKTRSRMRVLECLKMVGLEHTIDKLPSELSGGMQKRVVSGAGHHQPPASDPL